MKKLTLLMLYVCLLHGCGPGKDKTPGQPPEEEAPEPLAIGYSVPVKDITQEKLAYAKSAGIDYIELSGIRLFVDEDRNFMFTDEEIIEKMREIKKAADSAGMKIWSVHMPYGVRIDLSLADEKERKEVVAMHKKLVEFLAILEPEIILFHPSYYLGLNERDTRKNQLIRSAGELNEAVQAINATMVIENMLGPELLKDKDRERPLFRTVEETAEIMARLPGSIGLAVDMNHIADPEKLIRAMGSRLKTVHVADGTGKQENHYFPCSGEGGNDWTAILSALNEVGYKGPFMYECAYEDEKELTECYEFLYDQFITG